MSVLGEQALQITQEDQSMNDYKFAKTAILAIMLGTLAIPAMAKSIFVEAGHGADSNSCLKKTEPCRSLAQAFSLAGQNDRIFVGPGNYPINTTLAFLPGMQLTSTHGASATILYGMSASGSLFSMNSANKAVLGRKRKGFTLIVEVDATGGVTVFQSERVRIEGNRIVSMPPDFASRRAIFLEQSSRATIRYNTIFADASDPFQFGIFALASPVHQKYIISDNQISNAGTCISLGSVAPSNGNKTSNNLLEGCIERGIDNSNNATDGVPSKDKITGNAIHVSDINGRGISVSQGNPQIGKNLVRMVTSSTTGTLGIFTASTEKASIKDNLITTTSGGTGISDSVSSELSISGNSIDGVYIGVRATSFDNIKSLTKNNIQLFDDAACSIYVNQTSTGTLAVKKNFYSPGGGQLINPGSQIDCAGSQAQNDFNAIRVTFDPTSRAYKPKFKEIFN